MNQPSAKPEADASAPRGTRWLLNRVLTISGWTLVSRVLGLLRDRLWAGSFGASPTLDAFLTAFQLPNLFRMLFGEGALTAAVLPRYARLRDSDPAAAEAFAGQILGRMWLWLSLIAGLGMALAALLLWWRPSDKVALVAALVLPMVPYVVLICVSAVLGAVLNARRHFWVPAFAPVMLNVLLISTVGLSPEAEARLLPWAVLLAGVLTVALHLWAVRGCGGIPPHSLASSQPVREMTPQFTSAVFSSGVFQLGAFIDTIIAYAWVATPGAVAALFFANRLLQFPMAMIGHGTSTASFPELAAAAQQGWSATGARLREGAGFMLWWLIPAAIGLCVCAEPLVRAIYQVGRFDEASVAQTVLVTRIMALGLLPVTVAKFVMRAFQAHLDARTPLRISLATVAGNIALTLLAAPWLGAPGIAAAGAITGIGSCAAYLVVLRRRGAGAIVPWQQLLRPLFAGAVMAVTVIELLWLWPSTSGGWPAVARLAVAVGCGAAIYVVLAGFSGLRRSAHSA